MNGVIILNKPIGKTSHDMVNITRRLTGIKKIGHTGTLDPMATGVLPICIGKATKACELLTCAEKSYQAQFMLGMTTDTLDADGEVLTDQPVNVTKEQIEKTVYSFTGDIEQIPPMYSAIKVGGKKLYELARDGIDIEREKRKVTIYKIDIVENDIENSTVTIDVDCSKGTYIRTLCEDIGLKLGCGAFMTSLIRTRTANFDISQALTLPQLEKICEDKELNKHLIPVDELFDYPKVTVNERQKKFIVNGVRTRYKGLLEEQLYRVYDEQKEFLCISKCIEERLTLQKAFWA